MIINNFNFPSVAVTPGKADSPLLVDADRVLPFSITPQGFELITWRGGQNAQFRRSMNLQ
jgi:hypothetical protein